MKLENENIEQPQKPQLNIGAVSGSLFLEMVIKEIDIFSKDYLCDLNDPESGDREIQTGFEHFKGWLKDKYNDR